jgi:hypothetical protein
MRRSRFWAGLALAATFALLHAGPSSAATVTLGNANDGSYFDDVFGGDIMLVNVLLPDATVPSSPVNGTVISWMVNDPQGKFSIAVLHKEANGDYTNRRTSDTAKLNSLGAVSAPQSSRLGIRKGDFVALNVSADAHIGVGAGGMDTSLSPPIPPGQTASPNPYNPYHAGYSAVVRYCVVPDVTGRRLRRAKKMLQRADCTVGKITRPRHHRRKAKFVKSQSIAPASSVSDRKPIGLVLGKKSR